MDAGRRIRRLVTPSGFATLFVVVAYVWFGSSGFSQLSRLANPEHGYFAMLGEGFLHGHLYMMHTPDPRLTALPNPYEPSARDGINYLWDASFYKGRYYLYFSPVPILVFYIPYRLVRGDFPTDGLATLVFTVWAFLGAVWCVRRALAIGKVDDRRAFVPFSIWVLLIGFGNLIAFQFAEVRIYEASVMAGAAMTSMWACALVRLIESPSRSRAAWMGFWLGLAIAARPNLGVLLLAAALTLVLVATDRASMRRLIVAAALPLGVIVVMMLAYNKARFGHVGEFGHRYQLTAVSMEGKSVCRVCNLAEATRYANSLVHYAFWPISVRTKFPFLKVQRADPDFAISFPGAEEVVGLMPLVPLTGVATMLAFILALSPAAREKTTTAGLLVLLGGWLIIGGLSACWYVVARYELDFMLLIVAGTVICMESGLGFLSTTGVRMLPLRLATGVLACYSIITGLLLGFVGREEAFRRFNPDLFYNVAKFFGLQPF